MNTLRLQCINFRDLCGQMEAEGRRMLTYGAFDTEEAFQGQHAEIKDQITLAVRRLEDARMRLGKAIQYSKDGISIYDKG